MRLKDLKIAYLNLRAVTTQYGSYIWEVNMGWNGLISFVFTLRGKDTQSQPKGIEVELISL